jgi:peptidoglycan/xylan/chitin deacetylase (PgdA/CDA1 family)
MNNKNHLSPNRRFIILFMLPAIIAVVFASVTVVCAQQPAGKSPAASITPHVPILLYHRLGPTVKDGMTVTTKVFESNLQYLRDNGYRVIPLSRLVNYCMKKGPAPPPKSVVIVADDGHISIYTYMLPLAKKYNIPVTLFVYPSAISNASYAMTWQQLRELKKTGLFDIQSHTYWHPNFRHEKKRLKPAEYEKFVDFQFRKSREKLEKELGGRVDLLAWPFGIHDDYLENKAAADGYRAAFTIISRHAGPEDKPMEIPRYLMINSDQGKTFARILEGTAPKRNIVY